MTSYRRYILPPSTVTKTRVLHGYIPEFHIRELKDVPGDYARFCILVPFSHMGSWGWVTDSYQNPDHAVGAAYKMVRDQMSHMVGIIGNERAAK